MPENITGSGNYGGYTIQWKADELKSLVVQNGAAIISEFALTVEGESKKELRKGHGVETGTLRRSIHAALPGYDWGGDDVESDAEGAERGGDLVVPDSKNSELTVQVGSGLNYAMAVHQGHHKFQGYHFITNGLNKAKGKLPSIVARYKVQK